MLPIRVDLWGKKIMIIGSGSAAASMLRLLCRYADDITLLSSSPSEELRSLCMEKGADLLEKPYDRSDLFGMDYVFCVSPFAQVRKDAAAICRTMGIHFYMEGDPKRSDFALEKGTDE